MQWAGEIRERHIRRMAILSLFIGFLWLNSDYTFDGIYHVVLSARSCFYDTMDGELLSAIGTSTLAFGKTVSSIIFVFILWLAIHQCLKWLDYDAKFIEADVDRLRINNAKLMECLRDSNKGLGTLHETIKKVTAQNTMLAKNQDRIIEIRVELEKLSLKTKKPNARPRFDEGKTQDLFRPPKRPSQTSGRRPPRPQILTPKF